MTISQALKEKNKKLAKISSVFSKISSYNSRVIGSESVYDLDKLWDEYNRLIAELIDLKTKIHKASEPVRSDIFALSELKTKIRSISGLSTQAGPQRNAYSSDIIQMTAHFDTLWKDSQIESIQTLIDTIQEKLDLFNHTTSI